MMSEVGMRNIGKHAANKVRKTFTFKVPVRAMRFTFPTNKQKEKRFLRYIVPSMSSRFENVLV